MKREHDLSKMKSRPNPYAGRLPESDPERKGPEHPDFRAVLEGLIRDGAREIEAAYDHGELWVSFVEGPTAIGVARYTTEEEKDAADRTLGELRKAKAIEVSGRRYRLSFKYSESFGEPCWLIRVREAHMTARR